MKLSIQREDLLKPLQLVTGIVEKRQAMPILSNVLLRVGTELSLIATDLETELIIHVPLAQPSAPGEITVPARKLLDFCRSLPERALLEFSLAKNKLLIRSAQSKLSLATLPAEEYPCLEHTESTLEFAMEQTNLRFLIQRTCFAIPQQDVRYFLNGMLLEVKQGTVRGVATDGHRLSLNTVETAVINNACFQVIIPRKGVIELLRLLDDTQEEVAISIMTNHIRIIKPRLTFTSKLIDARFPDYERVLPKSGNKAILVSREQLRQSLTRVSILSSEKLRSIQLQLRSGLLRILANNAEREEAEEEISVNYTESDLDIALNEKYLRDIFDAIDDEDVAITFSDPNSSVLVESATNKGNSLFVIMPMRV